MAQSYYTPPTQQNVSEGVFDETYIKRLEEYNKRANAEEKQLRKFGVFFGSAIVIYLVIQTVIALVLLEDPEISKLYNNSQIFQTCFNILGISFLAVAVPFGIVALLNKKHYTHTIIPNNTIKPSKCIAWICFGMGTCIAANFVVNIIVQLFKEWLGLELTQGEILKPKNAVECIFEFIGIAIIPAICEEFAMRCCSLQLIRKYGTGFAVVVVSIVFGLLHGNVIQFLFAFIIGLVLAYVTVKTESIVPAVLIHCFNNGMSAVQDTVALYAGEKIQDAVTLGMFAFWIVTCIISAIYLFVKKDFKGKIPKGDTVLSVVQKVSAFFLPGMIVPFILLILLTLTTIKKI